MAREEEEDDDDNDDDDGDEFTSLDACIFDSFVPAPPPPLLPLALFLVPLLPLSRTIS